jgi:hypothetical protein
MKLKLLIFLSFITLLFSCRKPEDSPAPSSIIKGKKWKLTSYTLNGTEIIGGFSQCTLAFNADGVLQIGNAGNSHAGTWREFSDPPKIEMIINSNDPYVNLFNKIWESLLLNPSRIQLTDNKNNPQEIIGLDLIP